MLSEREVGILNRLDQDQVICKRCGARLIDYRRSEKCSADLDDPCPGFLWVEHQVNQRSE